MRNGDNQIDDRMRVVAQSAKLLHTPRSLPALRIDSAFRHHAENRENRYNRPFPPFNTFFQID